MSQAQPIAPGKSVERYDTQTNAGSWAHLGTWGSQTNSAIWLTDRSQSADSPVSSKRSLGTHSIDLLAVGSLVLLGASNLIDVYGSWQLWLPAALPATLLGCLIALAGRTPALRLWWQIVFLAIAQCVIGPTIALNETTVAHVVATPETIARGFTSTFGSYKYLIAVNPPTGIGEGSLMAVWTLCLWTGLFAGIFATAQRGWLATLSVVPVLANFAVCALLGTSTGVFRIGAGTLSALIILVWLSWRLQLLELQRALSASVIVLVAGSVGVVGCLLMPQDRTILRDVYEPPFSPYDLTSPLSGMRTYIKDHKDDTILTVKNLPAGTPVRMAVMDRFDGSVWNLSDSRSASDSSDYRRVGTHIATDVQGEAFTATFTVGPGFSETWLPLAGAAESVDLNSSESTSAFYYNTDTSTGIMPEGVHEDLNYQESGILPRVPTETEVIEADAENIELPQTQDVPDSVGKLATTIAGAKATDGEAAHDLEDTLKNDGWFSHGLSDDYPSQPGHGNYRVNLLLDGSAMVGDSEQYASAMALMARELGLPSRVVLGLLPKDESGEIDGSRTTRTSDGTTQTTFTGNDVTAWVEIKLHDYGWVAFYPTPKETKIPDNNDDLTPPSPQTLVRQPPVPLDDPLRDTNNNNSAPSIARPDEEQAESANQPWSRFGAVARGVLIYGSPLWAILALCGLIILIKSIQLAVLKRRGSPRRRIVAGWQAACALAKDSGAHVSGTRRSQAAQVTKQFDVDPELTHQLSQSADYAAFSGATLSQEQAQIYWNGIDDLRGQILASQTRLRRIWTRLNLRNLIGRLDLRRRARGLRGRIPPQKSTQTGG